MDLQNLKLKLITYDTGDISILKKISESVDIKSLSDLRDLVRGMDKIMCNFKGIGLAAPQVGIPIQLFIMNTGSGLTALANPVIIKTVNVFTSLEGCLSFPGKKVKIKRAKIIKLKAFDILKEKQITVKYRGLDSACAQHEIDHLNGILCMDPETIENAIRAYI